MPLSLADLAAARMGLFDNSKERQLLQGVREFLVEAGLDNKAGLVDVTLVDQVLKVQGSTLVKQYLIRNQAKLKVYLESYLGSSIQFNKIA